MALRHAPLKIESAIAKMKEEYGNIRLHKDFQCPDDISVKDFVYNFITEWNGKYHTVYISNGQTQCGPGRRRTVGDTFLITKFYLPQAELKDVLNILRHYVTVGEFSVDVCSQIERRVYFKRVNQAQTKTDMESRDEFGWQFKEIPEYPIKKKKRKKL